MDPPEFPSNRSPRRELQGPRPTPLKVRKDSHKIKKPPVAPVPPSHPHHHHPPHALPPPRPPVIIYTVSPKIIHANPNEFMSLVQRLTGPNTTSTSTAASSSNSGFFIQEHNGGPISPAARFASIEKTRSPEGRKPQVIGNDDHMDGIDMGSNIQRTGHIPGILSPNPNTLPPIPPNFFSPSLDNFNPLSFFHDFSPGLHSNRNNSFENNFNNFMQSPSTFTPQHINTPSPNTLDLFHSLFDL